MSGKRYALDEKRTRLLEQRFKGAEVPPLVICGYEASFHAKLRMAARSIEPQWVADALASPGLPNKQPGVRKHVGDFAMCVVDTATKSIVTVGYGRLNDPEKGRWQ